MNRLVFALAFIACTVQADTPPRQCLVAEVVRLDDGFDVYDGDTLTVHLTMIAVGTDDAVVVTRHGKPTIWKVRIRGYDTPEIRGGCAESKALAVKARDHVRRMVEQAGGVVTLCGLDFHSAARERIVASVRIAGERLEHLLPSLGLARHHKGAEARQSWCPAESEVSQ